MKDYCIKHGPWPQFEGMCVQCATEAMPVEGITCPFCGRVDFDQIGLKFHLMRHHCEALESVDDIRR